MAIRPGSTGARLRRRGVALVAVLSAVLALGTAVAVPAAAADDAQLRNYVFAVYQDLFGRDPDPTGLATWTSQLRGGAPRQSVANAITHSEEFRSGLITDAYDAYLGRSPDAAGLRFWLGQMGRGWTIAQIDSGFISSDEYYAANGNDPVRWVKSMYLDVLDRPAADAEAQWWAARLGHDGVTRASTALGILLSTEHLSSVVDGYYEWLLGRGLDPTGQLTWVGLLQRGTHDEDIIGGIVASDEYWSTASLERVGGIEISPGSPRVTADTPVAFTATLLDWLGNPVRDVTAETTFRIDPEGDCSANVCRATHANTYTVTASWEGIEDEAELQVDHGPEAATGLQLSTVSDIDGEFVPVDATAPVSTWAGDGKSNWWSVDDQMVVMLDGAPCAGRCGPFTAGSHVLTGVPKPGSGLMTPPPVTVAARYSPSQLGARLFTWGRERRSVR